VHHTSCQLRCQSCLPRCGGGYRRGYSDAKPCELEEVEQAHCHDLKVCQGFHSGGSLVVPRIWVGDVCIRRCSDGIPSCERPDDRPVSARVCTEQQSDRWRSEQQRNTHRCVEVLPVGSWWCTECTVAWPLKMTKNVCPRSPSSHTVKGSTHSSGEPTLSALLQRARQTHALSSLRPPFFPSSGSLVTHGTACVNAES